MLHFSLWNGGNKENWIQNSSLVQEFGFHGISKDLVIMTLLSNAHSRHLCQNLVEYSFYFIIHNKTYKDVLGESFLGLLMLKWFLTITLSKARISFLVTVRAFWSWLDNPDHLVLKVWSAVGLISWSSMVSDWHSLVNSFNIHRYCVCHKYILFNFSCHIMTDIYMQVHAWASVHVGGVFLSFWTLTHWHFYLFFPLQPLPKCRSGEFWNLVFVQFPNIPHHVGPYLVLDALAVLGLQVSSSCSKSMDSKSRVSLTLLEWVLLKHF